MPSTYANLAIFAALLVATTWQLMLSEVAAQDLRFGSRVPAAVESIYEEGIDWLAKTQNSDGTWSSSNHGNGVTALAVMALLSSGEDPNFGPYAAHTRRAIRNLIAQQDPKTGYIPSSMYHHGFAILALSEAYGAVDDSLLWQGINSSQNSNKDTQARARGIGEALDLAVRCALTSQEGNPQGAWRYSADAKDADTSIAGAVIMGLLAAKNAGIEVPQTSIDTALNYMRKNTGNSGFVAYSGGLGGGGESMNRSAVATLVAAVGDQVDNPKYRATLNYITNNLEHEESGHPYYYIYYMAQALFQGDYDAWDEWNRTLVQRLERAQLENGSFGNDAYRTSMSLLSLALNYRFLPIYER